MRRIGSISSETLAQTLRDYLFTQEIETQIDQGADGWNVWVLDEDHLEAGRRELAEFQADPAAEKYATASKQAQAKRQARLNEDLKARKQQVNMRERWERPIYQRIPVTLTLIVASIGVTVATGFGDEKERTNYVYIQHVNLTTQMYYTRLLDVRGGELWRLVTPIFLHYDWMHIVFNMFMLFQFGGVIEDARGKWRFLAMVLVIAVISNLAQFWGPVYQLMEWGDFVSHPEKHFDHGPAFGGMSGVVFGLFGYLWMKSRYAPEDGFYMPKQTVVIFAVWTIFCLTGLIPIANTAHLVGLSTGMAIALTPVMYRTLRRA